MRKYLTKSVYKSNDLEVYKVGCLWDIHICHRKTA